MSELFPETITDYRAHPDGAYGAVASSQVAGDDAVYTVRLTFGHREVHVQEVAGRTAAVAMLHAWVRQRRAPVALAARA